MCFKLTLNYKRVQIALTLLNNTQQHFIYMYNSLRLQWFLFNFIVSLVLLPDPGNQVAGRFLILSYFYGFLFVRSEQIDGTYCVAHRRWRIDGGHIEVYVYVCTGMHMYMCMHVCL